MGEVTAAELRARGISHPRAISDHDLVRATQFLLDRGVTLDEIVERGFTHAIAANLLRHSPMRGTDADIALDSVGIDREFSGKLRVAMGLTEGSGLGLTEEELAATRFFAGLRDIIGEEETLKIVRVMGSSTARVARATTSLLRVNFQTPIDNSNAPLADALAAYATLIENALPPFLAASSALTRRHIADVIDADQDWRVDESRSAAMQDRVIGFADLIGFTAFTEQADAEEFMAAMVQFESDVQDAVVSNGGTVVKLIGDEVMFATPEADSAVAIARSLLTIGRDIAGLDGMRVGLSSGDVINSGGDYYGTVVNVAARIVGAAYPEAVIATERVANAVSDTVDRTPLGEHQLKGIKAPVTLYRLHLLS